MNTRRLLPLLAWLTLLMFSLGLQAQEATEPSVRQIYDTASRGDLAKANQMVDQVIARHPGSAKAHYVKAELAARGKDAATARSELGKAEQLAPGLTFVRPEAVSALRRQIDGIAAGGAADRRAAPTRSMGAPPAEAAPRTGGFSLGRLLLPALLVIGVLLFLRRRRAQPQPAVPMAAGPNDFGRYPQQPYPPQDPGMAPQQGPGMYPAGYPPREGMGSSIARGLGTGLAIGAGAAAASEIGRRIFDHQGNEVHDRGNAANSQIARDAGLGAGLDDPGLNQDMGGQDFGIQDGGGWDDAGGGFGDVGGDDWDR